MILKVLICDDDKEFINKLRKDLTSYFFRIDQDIEIVEKSKDFYSIKNYEYDVIFMDIDLAMSQDDGILLSHYLKKNNPNSIIIFMSCQNNLVFKTFKVGGFQFIRKNNYQYDFNETMQQLKTYIENNLCYRIFMINGRVKKVSMKNVKYMISIGNEITVFCNDSEFTFRSTMKNAIETMNYQYLVQIQKTMAIHLDYIDDFKKWEVRCGKEIYKIGRIYQKEFITIYEKYLMSSHGRI